jgi:uncharacterized protein YejL (UPF0352 family)
MNEQALIETINELSMRLMVLGEAVNALARSQDPETRRATAESFRERAARAMQNHASHLTHRDDRAMTLLAAAFLEALGEPPSR